MKANRTLISRVERALSRLGLFFILLLGWASDHLARSANTPTDRVMRSLGLFVVALITAIGGIVDRVTVTASRVHHQRVPVRRIDHETSCHS